MIRPPLCQSLQQMVSGTIGEARYLLKPSIKRCLNAIEPRQEIGAQVLDEQKRVFTVLFLVPAYFQLQKYNL